MSTFLDTLADIERRFDELEQLMADPAVTAGGRRGATAAFTVVLTPRVRKRLAPGRDTKRPGAASPSLTRSVRTTVKTRRRPRVALRDPPADPNQLRQRPPYFSQARTASQARLRLPQQFQLFGKTRGGSLAGHS